MPFLRLTFKIAVLLAGASTAICAETNPLVRPSAQDEALAVRNRVVLKLKAGTQSTEALAPEWAEFDALIAKYHSEPKAAALVLLIKANCFKSLANDEAAAKVLYEKVVSDYPDTVAAKFAQHALHGLTPKGKEERQTRIAEAEAEHAALIGHQAPDFSFGWSSRPELKRLADLRGKVVVLDFWATWCVPCIASFPKIREKVVRFRDSPVVILGVTQLYGRVSGLKPMPIEVKGDPQKEYALTADFMQKHEMTWPVVFSDDKVFKDYLVGGIPSIVIIAPDGSVRHANLNPHAASADIEGKVIAILKEFGLPIPKE